MKKYLHQLIIILIIFSFFPVLTVAQGEECGFNYISVQSYCVQRHPNSECVPGSNTCDACWDGSIPACENFDLIEEYIGACGDQVIPARWLFFALVSTMYQ